MAGFWQTALAHALPLAPSWALWPVARQYIAGTTLEAMAHTVAALNGEGARATVDLLSEDITQPQQAHDITDRYEAALTRIAQDGLNSHISIKLSALGLLVDPALCEANVRRLVAKAAAIGAFVRIDMEDATRTDATLALYERLRAEGLPVGVVIQACLRRSLSDIRRLCARGPVNIRLCKGIYREARAIAYHDAEIIRRNYVRLLHELLDAGACVGIATHDERLVWEACQILDSRGLGPDRYEFQMLYGVDPPLRRLLLAQGHPVRVYVPFGTDWRAYSLRRLRENPAIAGHIARQFLARKG